MQRNSILRSYSTRYIINIVLVVMNSMVVAAVVAVVLHSALESCRPSAAVISGDCSADSIERVHG
jgi:hypothetical protein